MNALLNLFKKSSNGISHKSSSFGLTKKFRCKLCGKEQNIGELNPKFPDICFDSQCPGKGKLGKLEEIFLPNDNGLNFKIPSAPSSTNLGIGKILIPNYNSDEFVPDKNYSKLLIFICWCAGVTQNEIHALSTDKLKYQSQGIAILFAGILASLSGGYALYYVFYDIPSEIQKLTISILFGVLWGFIILNIDRSVIIGFSNKASIKRKLLMALPRLALAIAISFVIAVPIELQILKGTIDQHNQISIDEEVKSKTKKYFDAITSNETYRVSLSKQIDDLSKALMLLENDKSEEFKRKGTTGKGIGTDYNIILDQIKTLTNSKNSLIDQLNKLSILDANSKTESSSIENEIRRKVSPNESLPARIKSLSKAKAEDNTTFWICNMIQLLFIMVECFPVLMKLLQSSGPFDNYKEFISEEITNRNIVAQNLNEENRKAWKEVEELRRATEIKLYKDAVEKYEKKLKS